LQKLSQKLKANEGNRMLGNVG